MSIINPCCVHMPGHPAIAAVYFSFWVIYTGTNLPDASYTVRQTP